LIKKNIISWLGRQVVIQSFGDDFEVNVEEIRQLLDQVEDCGEAEDCKLNYGRLNLH